LYVILCKVGDELLYRQIVWIKKLPFFTSLQLKVSCDKPLLIQFLKANKSSHSVQQTDIDLMLNDYEGSTVRQPSSRKYITQKKFDFSSFHSEFCSIIQYTSTSSSIIVALQKFENCIFNSVTYVII